MTLTYTKFLMGLKLDSNLRRPCSLYFLLFSISLGDKQRPQDEIYSRPQQLYCINFKLLRIVDALKLIVDFISLLY